MSRQKVRFIGLIALPAMIIVGLLMTWGGSNTMQVQAANTNKENSDVAISDNSNQITVEVSSSDYTINSNSITINNDKFTQHGDPGAPILPVYSDLIELPDVGQWSVDFTTSQPNSIKISGDKLPSAPVPGAITEVETGSYLEEIDQPNPDIYQNDAYYPSTQVVTGQELWQRGTRYLQIKVFPFQYNPVQGMVKQFDKIDIQINLKGTDASVDIRSLSCANVASQGIMNPWATGLDAGGNPLAGALRVYTTDRGIHEISYTALQNAGIANPSTIDPATFDMMTGGAPIAIEVNDGGDGNFDTTDSIRFYAEPTASRFMTENVYWLSFGGDSALASPRITTASAAQPNVSATTEFRRTARIERSLQYLAGEIQPTNRPYDQDRFFDSALRVSIAAGVFVDEASYDITDQMSNPIFGVNRNAEITGVMLSDSIQASVRLVAGTTESTILHSWSGFAGNGFLNEHTFTESVPMDQFGTAPYNLGLRTKFVDLNADQTVFPDYLDVNYPSATVVDNNDSLYIETAPADAERIQLSGYSAGSSTSALIYDVTNPTTPIQITSVTNGATTVDFWVNPQADRSYFAANSASMLMPTLELDQPFAPNMPLRSVHTADYIAIVGDHPDLRTKPASVTYGVDDLLAYRQSQDGYTTMKVDIQDIYDEWSAGQVDQMAIRQFLNYAYCEWGATVNDAPSYVVLIGDGVIDFKKFYNTYGVVARNNPTPNTDADLFYEENLIPPYLDDVNDPVFRGEAPVDVRFVSFDDVVQSDGTITLRDYLADMHIGRLPVQLRVDTSVTASTPTDQFLLSPAFDLNTMITKIMEYEDPSYVPDTAITFAAGDILSSESGPRDKYRAESEAIIMDTLPANAPDALPPFYRSSVNRLYYDPIMSGDVLPTHTSATVAADDFRGMFDAGTSMAQWVGHGAFNNWNSPAIVSLRSVEYNSIIRGVSTPDFAANHKYAITVGYGCQSSYFTNLAFGRYKLEGTDTRFMLWHSLGESFLRAVDRGAIADIGATGNHFLSDIAYFNPAIVQAIYQDQIEQIGPALDSAKFNYATLYSGSADPNTVQQEDILATMQLLGDPALHIQRPPVPLLEPESTLSVSQPSIPQGQAAEYTVSLVNTGNGTADQNTDVIVDYDETALETPVYISDGGYVTTIDGGNSVVRWDDITVPATAGVLEQGTKTLTFAATVSYSTAQGQIVVADGNVDSPEIFAFDLNEANFVVDVPTAATPFVPTPEPTVSVPPTGSRIYLPILSR